MGALRGTHQGMFVMSLPAQTAKAWLDPSSGLLGSPVGVTVRNVSRSAI